MSSRRLSRSTRSALHVALVVVGAIAAPAACFFPSYTFNEPEPTGSGGAGGGGSSTVSATQSASSSGASTVTASVAGSTSASTSGAGGDPSTTSASSSSASSSSASSSASTSAASTSAASSSSTGMVMPEDCTDGIDNDLDGKIDCADPDCQVGFSCHNPLSAANIQAGWTGHYALADGAVAALPGNCPGATYPNPFYTGYRSLVAAVATCTACNCGAPQGESCSIPQLHVSSATCAEQLSQAVCQKAVNLNLDGACHVSGITGGLTNCGPPDLINMVCPGGSQACDLSVLLDDPTLLGGACQPTTQTPTVPPSSWNSAGRACQAVSEGKGCANSFACLPNAAAPFSSVCVAHLGDFPCTGITGYSTKHTFYDIDPADDRTCSDCQCSGPNGASCTSNVTTYSDLGCTNQIANTAASACSTYAGNPAVGSYKATNTMVTQGMCSSSGGMPTGSAAGVNAVTFCCQ